jgi:hypothetical protein
MAAIPREDLISTRLDGASGDQRIVDGPAGNPVGGRLPHAGKIVVAIETHQAEPAMDTSGNSIAWSGVARCGSGSRVESGIDLSQTVRSAAPDARVALCVKAESRGVVGMFGRKNGDQNGRIEKQL